jgi:hypothetical protein
MAKLDSRFSYIGRSHGPIVLTSHAIVLSPTRETGSDFNRAGGATVVSPALQRGEKGRVAPVSVTFSNPDEGAPGPSPLGTGDGRLTFHRLNDDRRKLRAEPRQLSASIAGTFPLPKAVFVRGDISKTRIFHANNNTKKLRFSCFCMLLAGHLFEKSMAKPRRFSPA